MGDWIGGGGVYLEKRMVPHSQANCNTQLHPNSSKIGRIVRFFFIIIHNLCHAHKKKKIKCVNEIYSCSINVIG